MRDVGRPTQFSESTRDPALEESEETTEAVARLQRKVADQQEQIKALEKRLGIKGKNPAGTKQEPPVAPGSPSSTNDSLRAAGEPPQGAQRPLPSRTKVYAVLIVLLLMGAAYLLLNRSPETVSSQKPGSPPSTASARAGDETVVPVSLVVAADGEISSFVTSTSNLRPLREVEIPAQSDGIVQRIMAEEGDYVRRAQALCILDETQLRMRLESAQQKLAQAGLQLEKAEILQEKTTAQLRNTKEDLQGLQEMYEDGLVSRREVSQIEHAIESLEFDQRVSQAEVQQLTHHQEELKTEIAETQLEISRTRIKAPFGGYITERLVSIGQTVGDSLPLFKLADFSPLFADIHLSEAEAHDVREDQSAVLSSGAAGTRKTSGRVVRVGQVVDEATGTIKVTVQLDEAGGSFRPGAFVRVDIKTDDPADSVVVPRRAIVKEKGDSFVFVARGGQARRVAVGLGDEDDDQVEILHGLAAGDQVVFAGQGALQEGTRIKPVVGPE